MSNLDLQLSDILESVSSKTKHVRYDFQEFGLLLAEKLNDISHKSLYIRLAKYENFSFLTQALSFALASNVNNASRAKIFMWKLGELKKTERLRAFIGLFPLWRSKEKKQLSTYIRTYTGLSYTPDFNKLHITLFFLGDIPGYLYNPLSLLIEKFYKNKQEYFEAKITAQYLRIWERPNLGDLLIVSDFSASVYKIYNSLKKYVLTTYTGKYKKLLQSLLKEQIKRQFFPHMTIKRFSVNNKLISNKNFNKSPYKISLSFDVCITIALSNFYKNKDFKKIYYSLNYGIGGCWHRKNL